MRSEASSHDESPAAADLLPRLSADHVTGGGARERIQISHEPPTKPAEVELEYRDDRDVLHHVTVKDVPQSRKKSGHAGGKLSIRDKVRRSLVRLQTVSE